jgi:peptide/nickel transport system permease protein
MRQYIIKRLLLAIPTLLGVSLIVFFMLRLLPGDIVQQVAGDNQVTPELRAQIEADLGLDQPALPIGKKDDFPWVAFHDPRETEYIDWLTGVVTFDFGRSLRVKTPISDDLKTKLPITVELALLSLAVSLLIALPIGTLAAVRQDSIADYIARSTAIGFLAIPSFWLATMIIVYASQWFQWATPQAQDYRQIWVDPVANLKFMLTPFGHGVPVGPAVLMGASLSGTVMRLMRAQMLEVLRQDYVRTAWAKGLRERSVVVRHAMKNAMIPVVTVIGLQVPVLLGGSVIIESVYQLPGMGQWLYQSIQFRDYTVVQTVTLMTAIAVVVSNLVVDITYAYLDPRIRYS